MGYKGTGKAFYRQYFAGAKGITASTSLLANNLAGRCTAPRVGDDGRYYKAVSANWECRRCAGLRYYSEGGGAADACSKYCRESLANLSALSLRHVLTYGFRTLAKPIHDKDLVDTIENLCQSPAVA